MEGCDAKLERGVLAALSIEVFALVIGKRCSNIWRKNGKKLEEYDLKGRRRWGRAVVERQKDRDEGKLV